MIVVRKIEELKQLVRQAKVEEKQIGLVPTMGYFHEGHLSLMRRAKAENDLVIVSLFVNPVQFGPNEDLSVYPRDEARDRALAESVGVDWLFIPEVAEMYPPGYQTFTEVTEISQGLCGASRPGHFRGVATVVQKLLNLTEAERAYFGEKDAQQLRVIRQMVADLNLTVQVIGCPIVRESDGLALSSRNVFLSTAERQAALILSQVLAAAEDLLAGGLREAGQLVSQLQPMLAAEPLATLDYLAIVDSRTLQPVQKLQGEILIALAVKIGRTRLIDNRVYSLEEKNVATNV
ncbi:MAG TPA: pantoate--beta-alanine ligase [Bacillota bacterium]|nr:pantoate--beta-alanine ligase [Bacillota bacterium]